MARRSRRFLHWMLPTRWLMVIALGVGSPGVFAGVRLAAASSPTYTVTSTADDPDATPGDGICATATGACTLRAAIQEANSHPGPANIVFSIPGSGVQTIQLGSALPSLVRTGITIDGYTQPGAQVNTDPLLDNAQIMVQLRGTGPKFYGFTILSTGNVIRGLALFNLLIPIYLSGANASNNVIAGNFIGTDATGTFHYTSPTFAGNGVNLFNGPAYNRIGGTSLADRNVIAGNAFKGINLDNNANGPLTTDYNLIWNNIIGLSPQGTALGNPDHGIDFNHGSSYNQVGGFDVNGNPDPTKRNVIAGNGQMGEEISHPSATSNDVGNQIVGNYVGTNVTGTSAFTYTANALNGINVEDGAISTTVAYNVVGNNGQSGIALYSETQPNTYGNQVYGNHIGVSLDGTAIPDAQYGVQIGFQANTETIGPNNVIANESAGIQDCCGNHGNTFTQNSIYNNSGLGIQISANNNNNVQPPTITQATTMQVSGSSCAGCLVEVFVADRGAGTPGQGKTYLGTATAGADGTFTLALTTALGTCLTATATDSGGDTSQFATNVCAGAAPPTNTPTNTPTPTSTPTATPTSTPTATATDTPTNTPTTTPTATTTTTPTPTATATNTATATATATGTWGRQVSGTGTYLKGVGCASASSCVVVGDVGTVLRTTTGGSSWGAQASGTSTLLYSVSCPTGGAGVCEASGLSGVMVGSADGGATWSGQASGTSNTLYGVACGSASACEAAGTSGAIVGTTSGGASWGGQPSGTPQYFYALACPSATTCYAVGGNGTIRATTNGGASWAAQASGISTSLRAVACPSASVCYAAGDGGAIVATTNGGASWAAQGSGTAANLRGVACAAAGACYAVGDGGTIVATTDGGATWGAQASGTTNTLRGVACAAGAGGGAACYAVGDAGTILAVTVGAGTGSARVARRQKEPNL